MARSIFTVFCLIVVVLSFAGVAIGQEQQGRCSDGTCTMTEEELRDLLIEVHQEGYKKGHEVGYQVGYQAGYQRGEQSWGTSTPSWGGESEQRWDSFDQLINPGRMRGTSPSR